jgi:RNA polymerase sigma-70 factor (ECF subfamily)
MSMMNEKECIEKILDGDREAYRELVERYQAGLIIHCENILKDRQEGEDIAQEAFIKAYQELL